MKQKKFIASMLTVAILLSMFFAGPVVSVKAAERTILFSESFTGYTSGTYPKNNPVTAGGVNGGLWFNNLASLSTGTSDFTRDPKVELSKATGVPANTNAVHMYAQAGRTTAGVYLKLNKGTKGYKNINVSYDRCVDRANTSVIETAAVEWSNDGGATWNSVEKLTSNGNALISTWGNANIQLPDSANDCDTLLLKFGVDSPNLTTGYGVNFDFAKLIISADAASQTPVETVPAAAPTVTAEAYSNGVGLTWTSVADATYYTVKKSDSAAGPFSIFATDIKVTKLTADGLSSGTYYFTVNGANDAGTGPDSAIVSAVVPEVPPTPVQVTEAPKLTAEANSNTVNLTWNTVANATYYTLSQGTSATGPFTQVATNINDTKYTVSGLKNETTYYFTVSGSNQASKGPDSVPAGATTAAAAKITQTVLYDEAFADYPSSVSKPGADYSAYTPGGIYGSGAAASYSWLKPSGWNRDAALQGSNAPGAPANTRMAHVYAPDTRQCGMEFTLKNGTSNYKDITVSYGRSAWYPKGFGPSSDDYMAVQWSVDGTNWNDVERIVKTQATKINGILTLTPWTNVTFKLPEGANDSATFKMRFYVQSPTDTNGTGAALNIDWSGIKVSGTYIIKDAPQVTYAKARDGYADFAWEAVTGATSYTLKMGTVSGGPYDMVYNNISGTTFSVKNLTNDTAYYYVICAAGDGGEGPYTVEGTVTPKKVAPDAPTGVAVLEGYKKVRLSWNLMDITDFYTVKMSENPNGPFSSTLNNITDTKCEIGSLENGKTYYFVVTGTNVVGESNQSEVVSAAPTAAVTVPGNVYAIPRNTSADISWDIVPGATAYELFRSEDGTNFTSVKNNITQLTYTDTGLANYKTYYYKVSAYNPESTSGQSAAVSVQPLPKPEAVANVTATPFDKKIVVSWQAAKDALYYTVKIGTEAGNYIYSYDKITDLSLTIKDLPNKTVIVNNTKYYITVSASNYSGEGVNSPEVDVTPMPAPATPGSVSAVVNENGIKLSWGAVATATSYTVLSRTIKAEDYTVLKDNITTNSFDFTNAELSKPYLFVVVANNQYGKSGYSGEVSAIYGPVMTISSTIPYVTNLKVYDYANYGNWSTKSDLQTGNKAYPDQNYLITGTDDVYKGMYWIQPAAASKSYSGTVLSSFTVTQSVYVYLAFDKRSLTNGGTTFPGWITKDGWEAVPEYITVNNDLNYSIVRRKFSAGETVTLGNNGGNGYLNYLIFIDSVQHEITVSDIAFADKNGNTVTTLKASEQLVAAVKVSNNVNSSKKITLIIALYDNNNTMVKYTSIVCSLNPMESKEFGCGIKLPDTISGYKVKAFIVNSMDEFRTAADKNTAVLK